MAKTVLGIDVGYDSLKLALVKGRQVKKTAIVPMPNSLVRAGRIVSVETMGDLLRRAMKKYGLRCDRAALALPNETVFIRNVTMPLMTEDQLQYNLPFEFRDYITDELKGYVFDYAMLPDGEHPQTEEEEEHAGGSMHMMAVAAPKALLDESREYLRKAGMKLVKAAPTVSCFQKLIRMSGAPADREYCILDLGFQSIRMYMFRGVRHIVTRVLEIGMSSLDQVIAEQYNVDEHLAHTYLLSNYEDCQNRENCLNAYGNITVELMRALNFYRFSNPDSRLEDIWICGGGAMIEALQRAIAETMDMKIHSAAELLPDTQKVAHDYALLQAIGIALE